LSAHFFYSREDQNAAFSALCAEHGDAIQSNPLQEDDKPAPQAALIQR
jgi:hypothetical protein